MNIAKISIKTKTWQIENFQVTKRVFKTCAHIVMKKVHSYQTYSL